MHRMTASEARHDFSATLKKARSGIRVLLFSHKKPVAALVSIEDLEILQALEDRRDAEISRAALAEVEEHGTIPWDDVQAAAGL